MRSSSALETNQIWTKCWKLRKTATVTASLKQPNIHSPTLSHIHIWTVFTGQCTVQGATKEKLHKLDELKVKQKAKDKINQVHASPPWRISLSQSCPSLMALQSMINPCLLWKKEHNLLGMTLPSNKPMTIVDLNKVWLTWDALAKHFLAPCFKDYIKGTFWEMLCTTAAKWLQWVTLCLTRCSEVVLELEWYGNLWAKGKLSYHTCNPTSLTQCLGFFSMAGKMQLALQLLLLIQLPVAQCGLNVLAAYLTTSSGLPTPHLV